MIPLIALQQSLVFWPSKSEVELNIMGSFNFKKRCLSIKDFDLMHNVQKNERSEVWLCVFGVRCLGV